MRLRKAIALTTLAACVLATPAAAMTVTFSGTVVNGFGSISAGDALNGTYDFDPTTLPRAGSNADFAVFDALTSLSFTVGGYSASAAPTLGQEIQVDDAPGAPNDRYGVVSRASDGLTGAAIGGFALDFFALRMDDATNSVFSTALALPTAPNLANFTSGAFFVFFRDQQGNLGIVDGTLKSLSTIPLPASFVLMLGGLAAFGFAARRRTA